MNYGLAYVLFRLILIATKKSRIRSKAASYQSPIGRDSDSQNIQESKKGYSFFIVFQAGNFSRLIFQPNSSV